MSIRAREKGEIGSGNRVIPSKTTYAGTVCETNKKGCGSQCSCSPATLRIRLEPPAPAATVSPYPQARPHSGMPRKQARWGRRSPCLGRSLAGAICGLTQYSSVGCVGVGVLGPCAGGAQSSPKHRGEDARWLAGACWVVILAPTLHIYEITLRNTLQMPRCSTFRLLCCRPYRKTGLCPNPPCATPSCSKYSIHGTNNKTHTIAVGLTQLQLSRQVR